MERDASKTMLLIFIVPSQSLKSNSGYTLAITNSTNPADAAAFYLPTIPLISGARPSCSDCTQQLFGVYDKFSTNQTLEISKNYMQAAQVVDLNCGEGFVSLGKGIASASWQVHVHPVWITMMGIGLALWMF